MEYGAVKKLVILIDCPLARQTAAGFTFEVPDTLQVEPRVKPVGKVSTSRPVVSKP